eukprot:SAG11_NODE_11488_length_757_cov_1.334347_2_plen_134_part_00
MTKLSYHRSTGTELRGVLSDQANAGMLELQRELRSILVRCTHGTFNLRSRSTHKSVERNYHCAVDLQVHGGLKARPLEVRPHAAHYGSLQIGRIVSNVGESRQDFFGQLDMRSGEHGKQQASTSDCSARSILH